MSVVIHPTKTFEYFDNVVDPVKTQQLYSFCIARSAHRVVPLIHGHSDNYDCYCFSCLICRLLIQTLLSRRHENLLQIVKKDNYLIVTDEYIYNNL